MAVPVMEAHPWTMFVFAGSLMTLVFGVLNLVVAVIVDTFAEKRARDMNSQALDLEHQEKEEKRALANIFKMIDEDNSGTLTLEELHLGAQRVAEFSHWLRILDVDECDLQQLFEMVDEDCSGEIDPSEFIQAMFRLKNTESKTATRFVKFLVTKLAQRQDTIELAIERAIEHFDRVEAPAEHTQQQLLRTLRIQESSIMAAVEAAVRRASDAALKSLGATVEQAREEVAFDE